MRALVIFLAFLTGISAFAKATESEDVSVPPILTAAPAAVETESTRVTTPASKDFFAISGPGQQFLWIGPGVAVYDGNYGGNIGLGSAALTMNLGYLTSALTTAPLYLGLDGSLHFWNSRVSNQAVSGTGIQLLPTLIYKFAISSAPAIHPFLGASFGPHLYVGQSGLGNGNLRVAALYLEFLIRPGVQWQLNSDFAVNFEPKIGFIGSDFVSIPQLTVSLAI